MNVLVWFKRDLRVHDHPALCHAAGLGPVLPVYIVEPDYWASPTASARQWEFAAESLTDLRAALHGLGLPLVLRVGDAVEVLDRLCRMHDIRQIISHHEAGTPWARRRDQRVAAWAQTQGIRWTELPQGGPDCPSGGPDGQHARQSALLKHPPFTAPSAQAVTAVGPGLLPSARALKLADVPCPHRQRGGRAQASALLESFLSSRGEGYRNGMASPLTGERSGSRLSPHLAWGTISVREVAQATSARQAERPGGPWRSALTRFQSNLALRGDFIGKPEDAPSIEVRDDRPFTATRPRESDGARLLAWESGETGLPFLDACLRYLRATGWLNARLRAMAISVATHHLRLDWHETGRHLARMTTDYEPGIHWPQVLLQSGTLAGATPRLWNPLREGRTLDPTCVFIRRWLPELAQVPDAYLHEPWLWPKAPHLLGRRYPEPIVDVARAARGARGRIRQAQQGTSLAETAARTDRPRGSAAQLTLDL